MFTFDTKNLRRDNVSFSMSSHRVRRLAIVGGTHSNFLDAMLVMLNSLIVPMGVRCISLLVSTRSVTTFSAVPIAVRAQKRVVAS